jgi:FlaA1/EpsC-like NDP-sugar epimerase
MAFSITLSSIILFLFRLALPDIFSAPRGVIVIDWAFSIIFLAVTRASIRLLKENSEHNWFALNIKPKNKVIIIGAGDSGEALLREIQSRPKLALEVIGFLDDNPNKITSHIRHIPILGKISDADMIFKQYEVNQAFIAIPSATGQQMRAIVEILKNTGVSFKTLPTLDQLVNDQVSISQIREVSIEDLLGREPVKSDLQAIEGLIFNKIVLVTGAGGSIGSELCRQICRFQPKQLVLVEQAENNLFYLQQELLRENRLSPSALISIIADITDLSRMRQVFQIHQPTVVFHAAAHKHVPMMEDNPTEAIKNNILGTKKIADLSDEFLVDAFVMISTDKAVSPTSVMGATKRAAEIYTQALNDHSKTKFMTVRFGNVLGSTGSVIPIFKEQIRRGGPLTVTHPEMTRYFMTIPEAVQLVLQAFALGKGGEIFTLDMGEPIKIVDMARDLIKLSGLTPDEDIEIVYTGVRPGEKLFEELRLDGENNLPTSHSKIKINLCRKSNFGEVSAKLDQMPISLDKSNKEELISWLESLVCEYKPFSRSSKIKETIAVEHK